MTLAEFLSQVRERLDDAVQPYLWSDSELTDYTDKVVKETCRFAQPLESDDNPDLCEVELSKGKLTYSLHSSILGVSWVGYDYTKTPLGKFRTAYRDKYAWRTSEGVPTEYAFNRGQIHLNRVPDEASINFSASTVSFEAPNKIKDSGSGFVTAGFEVDDGILVTGTSDNYGTYIVQTVSAGEITVNSSEIVDEAAGSSIGIQSRMLYLRAGHLPVKLDSGSYILWTLQSGDTNTELPIPERYQDLMISGVLGRAFGKKDAETFMPKKRLEELGVFQNNLDWLRGELVKHEESDNNRTTILRGLL